MLSPRVAVYLVAACCLTACFLVGWLLCPGLRRSSLLAALVLTPFAAIGAAFVPVYWQPDHRFTFIRGVGIEDVLFCFGCGGVCWIVAAVGSGNCRDGRVNPRQFLCRFTGWAVLALLAVLFASWTGLNILAAVIVGFTASGCVVLCLSPRTIRFVLPGAVGFTVLYTGVSWFILATWPQSAGFWVGDALSGQRILGLPVEELLWASTFGATWPVVFAWCSGCDWTDTASTTLTPSPSPPAGARSD